MPRPQSDETANRRRLPLWVGLALSVATVGPTLAMAGNGQGLVSTVGKAVPLVFVIGLVGISLVGYSFVRLTRHLNHSSAFWRLVARHCPTYPAHRRELCAAGRRLPAWVLEPGERRGCEMVPVPGTPCAS